MVCVSKIASFIATALSFECVSAIVPAHAKFQVKDGIIESVSDPSLRVNLKGGSLQAGDRAVLWKCGLHAHEQFIISDTQIRLMHNQGMCLNAKGGVRANASIVTFPCSASGVAADNEEFVHGKDGRIRVKNHPDLCMNVKGAYTASGAELVLWPCGNTPNHTHDIFEYKDNSISLKASPDLHFNIQGGKLRNSSRVLLWNCHAARHEIFELKNQQIQVSGTNLCLHAEDGLAPGRNLIAWHCNKGKQRGDSELFEYDEKRKVIYAVKRPTLGFNIKEGRIGQGSEVIIWPIDQQTEL